MVTFREVSVQSSPGVDSTLKEHLLSVTTPWMGWTAGLDWTPLELPSVMTRGGSYERA